MGSQRPRPTRRSCSGPSAERCFASVAPSPRRGCWPERLPFAIPSPNDRVGRPTHETRRKQRERAPHPLAPGAEPLLQRARLLRDISRQVQRGAPPQVVSQTRRSSVPEAYQLNGSGRFNPRLTSTSVTCDAAIFRFHHDGSCPLAFRRGTPQPFESFWKRSYFDAVFLCSVPAPSPSSCDANSHSGAFSRRTSIRRFNNPFAGSYTPESFVSLNFRSSSIAAGEGWPSASFPAQ
jgi:hypothetical protein